MQNRKIPVLQWKKKSMDGAIIGGGAVKDAKRLDYIFCNTQKKVKSSKVVCNGKNYPVVSDHYGVMIKVED